MEQQKLSFRERFCYGIGTGGEQFPFFFVNAYLMFFLNTVFGMPAMAVGTMFLIARIWDAINDPIMGTIADRTRSRWGSYRPWAFFATIPMGIFLVLCFTVPNISTTAKVVYMYIVYICFGMSNTASVIPLGSMLNVLTTDYQERSVLGSFRELGSSLGNLGTSIIVPALLVAFSSGQEATAKGYQMTAVVLAVLCFVVLAITFFNTKEKVKPPKDTVGFFKSFSTLNGNTPAICLILAFFFIALIMCLRQTLNAYYVVYYLGGSQAMIGMMLTIMSAALLVLLFFIPKITRAIGKRNVLILGCVVMVVAGIVFLIAGKSVAGNYVASFITGWGQVLTFSAIWSSLPDAADYGEFKTGIRAPGLVYSIANFTLKLSMSIGGFLIGVILTGIGFDETIAVQSAAAQSGLYWFNGLGIVISAVLGILCLIPYKLDAKTADEISQKLAKVHEEQAV